MAVLFSLTLLPCTTFAQQATEADTPAAVESAQAIDASAAAAEPSVQQQFQEKLAGLGEQPTPEQVRQTLGEVLSDNGTPAEEQEKLLQLASDSTALNEALQNLAVADDSSAAEETPAILAHDLSPWGMYQAADVVVKSVMIGLVIASILTWTVWIAKGIEIINAKRRLAREITQVKQARSLAEAAINSATPNGILHRLVHDAQEEVQLSSHLHEKDGLKDRVSFRQERLVASVGRQMTVGTGVLATIGSTAPFVGLFGTVWGIMNSFIGIAKSQTTNLAVVAPGIAEALLATALGLVAAIPAVIIYNVFARSISAYKAQVGDASAQVLLLLSRDLDAAPSQERSAQQPHMVKVG